jgi:nitrogen-specific signal transduction histidine kinase
MIGSFDFVRHTTAGIDRPDRADTLRTPAMDTSDLSRPDASDDVSPKPGDWKEVSRLAHDINNYLGAIAGFAEMLAEDAPPDSHTMSDSRRVQDAARRASELVNALSDYAKRSQAAPADPA